MSPPLTGRAFELRSAEEPHFSALLQSAETVCKNLDWTGLASFDFVLDPDGQFRFVEFNPRAWGSVDATLTAGVDLFGGIDGWIRCSKAGPPPVQGPASRTGYSRPTRWNRRGRACGDGCRACATRRGAPCRWPSANWRVK